MQAQGFGQDGQALPRRRRRAGNNFQSLPGKNGKNGKKSKINMVCVRIGLPKPVIIAASFHMPVSHSTFVWDDRWRIW
jgi:hypothetical protein